MPNTLTYLHNQILFNGEKIEDLNNVQLGELEDFIDELPNQDTLYENQEASEELENLQDSINTIIHDYEDSYNDLINDPEIDKKDLLNGFIEELKNLF